MDKERRLRMPHGDHVDAEFHHHHSHAPHSHHPGHHHLLTVEDLTVAFTAYDSKAGYWRAGRVRQEVLHGLTLSVHAGELLAVVGASGSGKTVLADALLGLYEPNAEVTGRIWFDGEELDADGVAVLRGRGVALVPQSVAHLDPLMKVGRQVEGAARGRTRAERARDRAVRVARQRELFAAYGLAPEVADLYPHQLSGGMARRVLLMCALMDSPRLIIADEPTPGLDLDLAVHALDDLRAFADRGGGVLLITHDLELALRVADRVAVFRDGTIVEETAAGNFADPALLRHPFTRALVCAIPGHAEPGTLSLEPGTLSLELGTDGIEFASSSASSAGSASGECVSPDVERPSGLKDAPSRPAEKRVKCALPTGEIACTGRLDPGGSVVLQVRGLRFGYIGADELYNGLDLTLHAGERLALAAPSGTGKTTLCRLLAGRLVPQAGAIEVDGHSLAEHCTQGGPLPVQLIAQHPEQAFDPRMRMGCSLAEAGEVDGPRGRMLCERFGVREAWLARFPHELSGGELMRCCMVRALLVSPRVLICDESTAMLDMVTQAELWRVICDLQEREGFGLILVSHSPALVRELATRVVEL